MLYDDTAERQQLEERITQVERSEHCVRRAVWLVTQLLLLAIAGLAFGAVLLDDFPQNRSHFIIKVLGALGLGSLICLLVYVALWMAYRRELARGREQSCLLVAKILESRLGKPRTMPLPGVVKEQEILVRPNKPVVSASEVLKLPRSAPQA